MSSKRSNLRLLGAFIVLATLALAVGCKGFFVKPTLSSLAVGPASPTIETGNTNNTVQMTVFGTNTDGSTTSNPSVAWSIDTADQSVATVSASGLVTSASVGTATVTATSNENPTITGTQTVTVTVGCISKITLSPTSGSISASGSISTISITAQATTCNGSPFVTDVATWTSSNNNLATVSAGVVSAVAGLTTSGQVQITASIGSVTSNVATISVSP